MAIMIPPTISKDVPSNAERRIFELLTGLDGDWTVLHSLGIAEHMRKPWAEIDFVLIGPLGVYCLEVKGGRVGRENGVWRFQDRYDNISYKNEGPFGQVGSAAAALFSYLQERLSWFDGSIAGTGVVFPDIEFNETGPDIISDIVYDLRDADRDVYRYIRRISDYWHKRLKKPTTPLTESQRKLIREELRGDFDLRPSLRTQIDHAVNELLRLTQEQYLVLDGLEENDRVIVRGGAGTGKTLLAVEEARRQAAAGRSVLLCCFNKRLAQWLGHALADLPTVMVNHLHGLMAGVIQEAGLREQLPAVEEDDLFTVFYPELCIKGLRQLHWYQTYDVLIVDEAQDLLRDTYIEVFDALLKGGLLDGVWRVFWDPFQNIYLGSTPSGLNTLNTARPARFLLSVNCRNTRPIATAVRILSGIDCQATLQADGPKVIQRFYRDDDHQCRLLVDEIEHLLKGGVKSGDIIILSARRLNNSVLGRCTKDFPYRISDIEEVATSSRTLTIRFSTIPSFKGLESDAVLLIDVDDLEDDEPLSMMYVGGSRSKAYLAIFIAAKQQRQYENRAFEYGRQFVDQVKRLPD